MHAVSGSPCLQVEAFEGKHAALIIDRTSVLCCVYVCFARKTTTAQKVKSS
jgi:hypothetical protein